MPATDPWKAASVGEELRRRAARRRSRRRLAAAILCASPALPLLATLAWEPPVVLVWNASASAPEGLYLVRSGPVRNGDMVIAWPPEKARALAARRAYLPANVPLVKRVAAVAGDRVCASGAEIRVNGVPSGRRLAADARGRALPRWTGCRTLRAGEHFLLMNDPHSFDGRYFGITRASSIVGRARLLWRA